jgi:hypothetical protein
VEEGLFSAKEIFLAVLVPSLLLLLVPSSPFIEDCEGGLLLVFLVHGLVFLLFTMMFSLPAVAVAVE